MLGLVSFVGGRMSQRFSVKLHSLGQNRVPVLALAHPLSKLSPRAFREAIESGPVVVLHDVLREVAQKLASKLETMGAEAEIFMSIDDCCC